MTKITLEKLAQMVGNGFNDTVERFKRVDDKFAQVNNQLKEVDKRLYEMDTDIRYIKAELSEVKSDVIQIKDNTTPPVEFEDLSGRIRYVERKLGIKSGK
jgi:archaellum component FlaC